MKKKSTLLLAIDIGNTSISYGIFKNGRLLWHFYSQNNVIPKIDHLIAKSGGLCTYNTIIASVNPRNYLKIKASLKQSKRCQRIDTVGKSLPVEIRHKYNNINKLGNDRLVNAYGIIRSKRTPSLLFSFGTAVTVDFINKKGVFEGGLIIPGMKVSFEALQEKAALLPKVGAIHELSSLQKHLIGRDAKSCMILGLFQGFGSMVDGLIGRFRQRYGNINILMTGGFSNRIKPYIKEKVTIDPLHTLKALELIYQNRKGSKNGKR